MKEAYFFHLDRYYHNFCMLNVCLPVGRTGWRLFGAWWLEQHWTAAHCPAKKFCMLLVVVLHAVQPLSCLYRNFHDKNPSYIAELHLFYQIGISKLLCYGNEVWDFFKNEEKTILTFKWSFLKICAGYMETFPLNKQKKNWKVLIVFLSIWWIFQ